MTTCGPFHAECLSCRRRQTPISHVWVSVRMISTTLLELSVPDPLPDNGLSKQLVQHILHLRRGLHAKYSAVRRGAYVRLWEHTGSVSSCTERPHIHVGMTADLQRTCGNIFGNSCGLVFFEILEWGCSYFRRVITTWLGAILRCRDVSAFRTAAVHQVNQVFSANSGINVLQ